jgi:hypothetical protein
LRSSVKSVWRINFSGSIIEAPRKWRLSTPSCWGA